MLKVWEYIYTVTIPSGTQTLGFALPAPQYGYIKRFSIKQSGGTSVAATINVYSLPVVATTPSGQPKSNVDPDLAKIVPQISVAAEQVAEVRSESLGHAYFNNFSGIAVPDRNIYVNIAQSSNPGQATTWKIALVIAEPT